VGGGGLSDALAATQLLEEDDDLLMRHGIDGFSPSSSEPQEEGMMSTAVSFSLSKKPRFIVSRKKPNVRR
jgi:hypothetical protein